MPMRCREKTTLYAGIALYPVVRASVTIYPVGPISREDQLVIQYWTLGNWTRRIGGIMRIKMWKKIVMCLIIVSMATFAISWWMITTRPITLSDPEIDKHAMIAVGLIFGSTGVSIILGVVYATLDSRDTQ